MDEAKLVKKVETCDVCGLDNPHHKNVADCMEGLMNYINQDIRDTPAFKNVLKAGVDAMRRQIDVEVKAAMIKHAPVAW